MVVFIILLMGSRRIIQQKYSWRTILICLAFTVIMVVVLIIFCHARILGLRPISGYFMFAPAVPMNLLIFGLNEARLYLPTIA